jgi:type II secretory pathway component PulK
MSSRRGMTLIIVLVMSALIGMSAMLLFSTTNMEMMIAGNTRRINQAKISAASGLSHFIALNLDYNTLRGRAGGLQTLQVLPRTRLSNKTSYEVKVYFSPRLSAGQYVVESIGYYTKGDKILSLHPIKALFEGGQ